MTNRVLSIKSHDSVTGSTVFESDQSGGGILQLQASVVSVHGIVFRNGSAATGGAILAQDSTLSMYNCILEHNSASSSSGGGAVSLTGLSIGSFYSTVFTFNSATGSGGAVVVYITPNRVQGIGGVKFQDCTFSHNQAVMGGAVHVVSALSLHMNTCNLEHNAAAQGGGVSLKPDVQGDHQFLDSVFWNNTAADSTVPEAARGGGALLLMDGSSTSISTTSLTNTLFDANTANGDPCIRTKLCKTPCPLKLPASCLVRSLEKY